MNNEKIMKKSECLLHHIYNNNNKRKNFKIYYINGKQK